MLNQLVALPPSGLKINYSRFRHKQLLGIATKPALMTGVMNGWFPYDAIILCTMHFTNNTLPHVGWIISVILTLVILLIYSFMF